MARISTMLGCGMLLCLLCTSVCRKTAKEEERGYSALDARTRIVRSGPYELALELMTMEKHEDMMRRMKLTMQHDAKAPHVLMLTVIDKRNDRLVRDATVQFALFPMTAAAPGAGALPRKTPTHPHLVNGMNMSGDRMFHYAADFPYAASGIYRVGVTIKRAGAPTVRQEVEFEL